MPKELPIWLVLFDDEINDTVFIEAAFDSREAAEAHAASDERIWPINVQLNHD